MSKLPIIKAAKLEKILIYLGFIFQRQKGSHSFYRHPDGRYTTIPHHPGKDLPRELIRTILKQINLSAEEFLAIINKV
jgi:predicted RNA binding protein YcfA (HicA-like mRNA interferase family)